MSTQTQSQTTDKNSYTVYSSVDTILSMVETRSHNAIVDSILSHVQYTILSMVETRSHNAIVDSILSHVQYTIES